jgi:hypothetical protein
LVASQHNPFLGTLNNVSDVVGVAEISTGKNGTELWHGPQFETSATVIVCVQVATLPQASVAEYVRITLVGQKPG